MALSVAHRSDMLCAAGFDEAKRVLYDPVHDRKQLVRRGQMPKLLSSRWLWGGVALLLVGTGPLVVAMLYAMVRGDPNPNPVGPGICAMFTFWPSIGMMAAGLAAGHRRAKAERDAADQGKR